MRLMISGSRGITDKARVFSILDSMNYMPSLLIHGGARGVDALAGTWASARGIPVVVYPADWSLGRGAGFIRNCRMLGAADAVLALWDGESPGTAHALRIALVSGKSVYVWLPGEKRVQRAA